MESWGCRARGFSVNQMLAGWRGISGTRRHMWDISVRMKTYFQLQKKKKRKTRSSLSIEEPSPKPWSASSSSMCVTLSSAGVFAKHPYHHQGLYLVQSRPAATEPHMHNWIQKPNTRFYSTTPRFPEVGPIPTDCCQAHPPCQSKVPHLLCLSFHSPLLCFIHFGIVWWVFQSGIPNFTQSHPV